MPTAPSTTTGTSATHHGHTGRRRSCSMASSTPATSGTSVTWSSMMARMLRTRRSSLSHTVPSSHHHTWLSVTVSRNAAVHRLSRRLELSAGSKALPRLSSR